MQTRGSAAPRAGDGKVPRGVNLPGSAEMLLAALQTPFSQECIPEEDATGEQGYRDSMCGDCCLQPGG